MKKLEDQPWWGEMLEVKDSLSLRQLAERFGVSPAAIANALKRNGIPRKAAPAGPRSSRNTAPIPPRRRGRQSKLDKFHDQMGKVVDREIAEKAGVTVSAVTNYRKRKNIKASAKRGRPRTRPAPVAAADSRPTNHPLAFRVVINGEAYVVIATNIADAATIASESGRGEVTHVELLGPTLV